MISLNNYRDHYDSLSEVEREKLFKYSCEEKLMPKFGLPFPKKLYLTAVARDLIAFKREEEAVQILLRGLETKCQPEDDYPIHNFFARFYDNGNIGHEKTKSYCETMLRYINRQNVDAIFEVDSYPNYIYCRDKYFEIVIEKESQLDRYEELLELFKVKGLLPNTEKGLTALSNMKSLYHQTSFRVAFDKDLTLAEFHAVELSKFSNFLSSENLKKLANLFCEKSDFQKATLLLVESIKQYPFVKGIARLKKKLNIQFQNILTEEDILRLKMEYIKKMESHITSPYDYKFISDLYKDVGLLELSEQYLEKFKSPNS